MLGKELHGTELQPALGSQGLVPTLGSSYENHKAGLYQALLYCYPHTGIVREDAVTWCRGGGGRKLTTHNRRVRVETDFGGRLKQICLSTAYEEDRFMPESIQGLAFPLEATGHMIAPNIKSDWKRTLADNSVKLPL